MTLKTYEVILQVYPVFSWILVAFVASFYYYGVTVLNLSHSVKHNCFISNLKVIFYLSFLSIFLKKYEYATFVKVFHEITGAVMIHSILSFYLAGVQCGQNNSTVLA